MVIKIIVRAFEALLDVSFSSFFSLTFKLVKTNSPTPKEIP
jgi:hypothetical protein